MSGKVQIWDSCYTVLVFSKPTGIFRRSSVVSKDRFEDFKKALAAAESLIEGGVDAGFVIIRSDVHNRVDAEWVNIGEGVWLRRK